MARRTASRIVAIPTVMLALVASTFALLPSAAQADTAPLAGTPETVSSDALPTVQINGVVWDQAIVGNTVYVAGEFTTARPAGAAPGVNTVPRANMLAYNLTTGALITSFAPSFNAQVKSISPSADGTRIYVGGNFTTINGVNRYRVAALDPTTGAPLASFAPIFNGPAASVVATSGGVYVGGNFTSVKVGSVTTTRTKVAAVSPTGALLPWAPAVADNSVIALTASPDGSKIVLGGSFTKLNNSDHPGYGLGMVDSTTGTTNLPLAANEFIRNGGAESAILSLKADGDGFYGSGYHFGGGGNVEGSFQADWSGNLTWVEDCHGDTYDVQPVGDVIYSASHKHYCGNIGTGGFPQTDPWSFKRATATTKFATGVSKPDIYGYQHHAGQPSPTLLNFFPDINVGAYTGKSQGPWTVEGNNDYVIYGGEFTRVNNVPQQGLVRLAKRAIAPNVDGPRIAGAALNPTLSSYARGTVAVSWPGNYDRDNSKLTYKIYRGDMNTVVYEGTQDARFWEVQRMRYVDKTASPGSSTRYRVQTIDPLGNLVNSEWVTVAVASSGEVGEYGEAVLADGATNFWRLGEPSGSAVVDWAGAGDATAGSGVTRGATGALANSSNGASTFDGSGNGFFASPNSQQGPNTFSTEAWFKTTTTSGGKIVGFGNSPTGNSNNYDRHTYMDGSGKVIFGVYNGSTSTIRSAQSYNDGQWHQAVASLSPAGMALFIDGKKVASRSDVTTGQFYTGQWRVGGDSTWEGDNYFDGDIDEVSVYPTALTSAQVNQHWVASGRSSVLPTEPGDAYGKKVFQAEPDIYWRLDDTSGSTAKDYSIGENDGTYRGSVERGAAGVLSGNAAVKLGASATVVAQKAISNPTTFSEEVWIKTSTTQGGRIMGFGTNGDGGTSNGYDRHMYMLDNGVVRFGVWNGSTVTIDSQAALNDNAWHHLAATVGNGGMNFYVDGVLQGHNDNTQVDGTTGYWRLGGDNAWGGNSSMFFDGLVDEAAVYYKVLSPEQIADHWVTGSGVVPNVKPVAAFESTADGLDVSFDGTGSSDSDGTVESYAWAFGDGTTSTQVSPDHTYSTPGDKSVTLTVTDDDGATDSVTKTITVAPLNVKPTAAFTSTVSDLAVSFDGASSSDPDGTVDSYAWDFGDGATSTQVSPNHTYTTAGDKSVTLTVTDDDGATDTVTKTVTATSPPNIKPTAAFSSSTSGLSFNGTSTSTDSDGSVVSLAWDFGDNTPLSTTGSVTHTYTVAGDYEVTLTATDDDGATDAVTRTITVTAPPANVKPTAAFSSSVSDLTASFDGAGSTDSDGTVDSYAWTFGDGATSTQVSPNHTYTTAGDKSVTLTVTDDDGATDSITKTVTVTAPPTDTPFAQDAFGRTVAGGFGSAQTGGAWTVSGGSASFAVNGSKGVITIPSAGAARSALLSAVSSDDTDITADVSMDKAATGGGTFVALIGRSVNTSNNYRAKIRLNPTAGLKVEVTKVVSGAESIVASTTVPGITYAAGDSFTIRFQVTGSGTTSLKAKAWRTGTTEPAAWTVQATDTTAALQVKGGVGFYAYVSGSTTNAPQAVSFDNLVAGPVE